MKKIIITAGIILTLCAATPNAHAAFFCVCVGSGNNIGSSCGGRRNKRRASWAIINRFHRASPKLPSTCRPIMQTCGRREAIKGPMMRTQAGYAVSINGRGGTNNEETTYDSRYHVDPLFHRTDGTRGVLLPLCGERQPHRRGMLREWKFQRSNGRFSPDFFTLGQGGFQLSVKG